MMYRVTAKPKGRLGLRRTLEIFKTEKEALKFCEMWGWSYCDEDGKSWWLDYEEMECGE